MQKEIFYINKYVLFYIRFNPWNVKDDYGRLFKHQDL